MGTMMRRSRAASMGILMALLPAVGSCGPGDSSETLYPGNIYNSADGTCDLSGMWLDYFMDGVWVATIGPGDSVEISNRLGSHHLSVRPSGTDTPIPGCEYDLFLDVAEWWFWCGCGDGTHP